MPSQRVVLDEQLGRKIWSTNLHLSVSDRCEYKSRFQKSFEVLLERGDRSTPHPCKLEERLWSSSAKPRVVLGEELGRQIQSTNLHLSVSDRCEYKSGFQKSFEVKVRGERSTPSPLQIGRKAFWAQVPSQE